MDQNKSKFEEVKSLVDVIETTSKLIGYKTLKTGITLKIVKPGGTKFLIVLNSDKQDNALVGFFGGPVGPIYFTENDHIKLIKFLKSFLEKL